jgi:hypothetical protein
LVGEANTCKVRVEDWFLCDLSFWRMWTSGLITNVLSARSAPQRW